jgi:acyl carrier protein
MSLQDGSDLHTEVKRCMIDRLDLQQSPEDIADDIPLFNEGLGLDSIDALDLIVAFGKRFNVVIEEEDFGIFASVNHIVEFIVRKQDEAQKAVG